MKGELQRRIEGEAPSLTREIEALASSLLRDLIQLIESDETLEFRPKLVNDPIWGTIELLPWEIAILDTPLLQRMRGVRQLGLAHLVFPGACHSRLEHTIGVVGAIEEAAQALARQIARWNRDNKNHNIPLITDGERYALRLAGLLHDIGHGPFSHATEPVLEVQAPLGGFDHTQIDWRSELKRVQQILKETYQLNDSPSISETIAILIVRSSAMGKVLASDRILTERNNPADDLQNLVTAAIIGGLEGPGASHLSSIVSSQIDADKLDYLARDAHHAGLDIGFDTDRLLARLEILRVREENLDGAVDDALRTKARNSEGQTFHQLGIAGSGFGSFEQMLIGRTFLYDRLYHHHKVRTAEAMAQRLILIAERDRGSRLSLSEIFLPVDDDTMLRIFSGDVTHKSLRVESAAASTLAKRIIDRKLLHRAFAFRGRFIASPPGMEGATADANRRVLWTRIVKTLDSLRARYNLGKKIFEIAKECCQAVKEAGVDVEMMDANLQALEMIGPEQIIVDLPSRKAEAIRILARYPSGSIKVPEFSFNPVKWSDAYDLQKRTGYVFCPREVARVIGLASKIVFLLDFGTVMADEANGYLKAKILPTSWIEALVRQNVIDQEIADHLTAARHSLVSIRAEDLHVPDHWLQDDQDFATRLADKIQKSLRGGLIADHLTALGKALGAVFGFIDNWFENGNLTEDLSSERELQGKLCEALRYKQLQVVEGSVVGGGSLDLFVENAIVIENKFHGKATASDKVAPAAGMQGRRYAIALNSQVVLVMAAYKPKPGELLSKPKSVSVHSIGQGDENRVEIRCLVPFGAVIPSQEKAPDADE